MEFPGEKLVIKMWETLADKGIGSLLKPWKIVREGRAHNEVSRARLLEIAQAERYMEDIRSGKKQLKDFSHFLSSDSTTPIKSSPIEHRIEPTLNLQAILEVSERSRIGDLAYREINVAKAIIHAEESLRNDPQEPPEEKIYDDWLFRWRNYASEISADEMQFLWGKLLAGELKAPGSFSLRCLDFMRNLSQKEANIISKCLPFVIGGSILWANDNLLFELGEIKLDLLLEMQDIGVLSGVEVIHMFHKWETVIPGKFEFAFRFGDRALIVRHDDPKKEPSIPAYKLTSVGREIYRLVQPKPHLEYLQKLGKLWQENGFSVSFGDVIDTSEKHFQCHNESPIDT